MIAIFLFSSILLNPASALPANNLEWRLNVFPLELEVIIVVRGCMFIQFNVMVVNVTTTSMRN